MLRPTPGRLLYLLIGMVIGGILLYGYVATVGAPAFLPPLRATAAPAPAVSAFRGASLLKVIAINQQASKNGVVVRVNSLEQYVDGFSLTYSIISGQPGEPAPDLRPDQVLVTDDLGGAYHLSPIGSSASVAPGLSSGYLTFAPAPGPNVKTLDVTVPHVLTVGSIGDNGNAPVVDGPWQV